MDSEKLGSKNQVSASEVQKTTNDLTYYIDPTGSDNNSGTSASDPFRTIEKIWETLPTYILHDIIVNCAAGTYTDSENILNGLIITEGSILIDLHKTAEGGVYTATGGDNLNADGLGEITVATAGWTVNEHAGRFVRFITTTSPTAQIDVKYVPISSNTADTLITTNLLFTPNSSTTFDIVTFDSILTGSTAASPTVGLNIPLTVDENTSQSGSLDTNDGLYTRYGITFDGLNVKNAGAYQSPVKVNNSTVLFRGVEATSDTTINAQIISAGLAGSKIAIVGAKTTGQVGGITYCTNGATSSIYSVYCDMTTSTYPQRYIATADVRGWVSMGSYHVFGDAGNMILGVLHSDGSGSNAFLGQGRAEYTTSIIDAGKNSYCSLSSPGQVYGANNVYLYTGASGATIKDSPQSGTGTTSTYNIDDTVFISNKAIGKGIVSVTEQRETLVNVASTEIATSAKNQLLQPTAPVTMTSTPTIEDGIYDGQRMTLYGGTNATTLQDDSILAGSNLFFSSGANKIIDSTHAVNLIWNDGSSQWEEFSF